MGITNPSDISRQLSTQLDEFGYGTERVTERVKTWEKISKAKTLAARQLLKLDKLERIHAGSQGEGIALAHESDIDILQANYFVMCLEDITSCNYNDRVVFYLERHGAPPGYAFLCFTDKGIRTSVYMNTLRDSAIELIDKRFLSSKQYIHNNLDMFYKRKGYISQHAMYHAEVGPSIPKTTDDINEKLQKAWFEKYLNTDIDFVQAFPCECPSLLESWRSRSRHHLWPSPTMIDNVLSLQAYVVPVGKKGSSQEDLQWRISFTAAEMYLVQSMNDTQRKVLIVLRHIAKYLLKSTCQNITSYIMKNIAFWMAEMTPLNQFVPNLLIDRLKDALKFLHSCISKKSLKNYMIPERDLLQDKLTDNEQAALANTLSVIIESCEEIVYNLYTPSKANSQGQYDHNITYNNRTLGFINQLAFTYIKQYNHHNSTNGNQHQCVAQHIKHVQSQLQSAQLADRLTFFSKVDILATEVTDLFTTGQLVQFIVTTVAGCAGMLQYELHHHCHITLPYLWRHRRRLLTSLLTREPSRMTVQSEIVYLSIYGFLKC